MEQFPGPRIRETSREIQPKEEGALLQNPLENPYFFERRRENGEEIVEKLSLKKVGVEKHADESHEKYVERMGKSFSYLLGNLETVAENQHEFLEQKEAKKLDKSVNVEVSRLLTTTRFQNDILGRLANLSSEEREDIIRTGRVELISWMDQNGIVGEKRRSEMRGIFGGIEACCAYIEKRREDAATRKSTIEFYTDNGLDVYFAADLLVFETDRNNKLELTIAQNKSSAYGEDKAFLDHQKHKDLVDRYILDKDESLARLKSLLIAEAKTERVQELEEYILEKDHSHAHFVTEYIDTAKDGAQKTTDFISKQSALVRAALAFRLGKIDDPNVEEGEILKPLLESLSESGELPFSSNKIDRIESGYIIGTDKDNLKPQYRSLHSADPREMYIGVEKDL